jgi:hypothetical protein
MVTHGLLSAAWDQDSKAFFAFESPRQAACGGTYGDRCDRAGSAGESAAACTEQGGLNAQLVELQCVARVRRHQRPASQVAAADFADREELVLV